MVFAVTFYAPQYMGVDASQDVRPGQLPCVYPAFAINPLLMFFRRVLYRFQGLYSNVLLLHLEAFCRLWYIRVLRQLYPRCGHTRVLGMPRRRVCLGLGSLANCRYLANCGCQV